MMIKRLTGVALLLFASFLILGCTTMYRRAGFAGGYRDYRQQVAGEYDGQFYSVTFSGNGFTSPSTARQFFLARAGELALSAGYKFFTILDENDLSTFQTHLTSRTNYGSSSSYTTTNVYNIQKPAFQGVVYTFDDPSSMPRGLEYFDAQLEYDKGMALNQRKVIWKFVGIPFTFGFNLITWL